MIIHLRFIWNVWISATPSATVTLPFSYPHILKLLTSNSLLSMMIASLASVIQLSLTYPHVPDEAQMNNNQALYLVSIRLIFVFTNTNLAFKKTNRPLKQYLTYTQEMYVCLIQGTMLVVCFWTLQEHLILLTTKYYYQNSRIMV